MSDLISRQAVIDSFEAYAEMLRIVLDNTDIVGNEREKFAWGLELIESFISNMKELPSAEPRKKGKWLRSGSAIFPYECDQCGDTTERNTPFCPHCGSCMKGDE